MSRFGIQFVYLMVSGGLACVAQDGTLQQRLAAALQLRAAGRYQEAEQALAGLLQDARRLEPGSVFVATVLDNLGATEQDMANYAAAEHRLTEALAQLRRAGVRGGESEAVVTQHLGETYLEEARYREAEALMRRALAMVQAEKSADPEKIAIAMLDLAVACKHNRGMKEAEQLLRQALAILEARLGPNHPILASVLGPLSTVLMRTGRYDEALEHAENAWRILKDNPSVGEPDRLNTLSSLGTIYSLVGRSREADFYSKEAVTRAGSIYGPEHPRLAYYLKAYADVLRREGRTTEAQSVEKRSNAIFAHQAENHSVWQHTVNVNALR